MVISPDGGRLHWHLGNNENSFPGNWVLFRATENISNSRVPMFVTIVNTIARMIKN